MALNVKVGITTDSWHREMSKCSKYTKCNIQIHMGTQVPLMLLSQNLVSVHWTNGCVHLVFICLQEIRCCCSRWNDPFRVRHCSEQLWLSCVCVFEDHNGGDVAAAIAVVGSRPHRDQLLVKHELVAFVDELMCSADQLQVVDVNKLQFLRRERETKEGEKNNIYTQTAAKRN